MERSDVAERTKRSAKSLLANRLDVVDANKS
jgi:hypothetical protein